MPDSRDFSKYRLFINQANLNRYIPFFVDKTGRILNAPDKWAYRYTSMIVELIEAGDIREYFDLKQYRTLDEIPNLPQYDPALGQVPLLAGPTRFFNKRDFLRSEDPERFYMDLPTAVCNVYCRIPEDLFFCAIRAIDTIPQIFPNRPSGIIFTDPGERLIGFNHAFHHFFRNIRTAPRSMLNRPLSLFLSPTPGEIQARRVREAPAPPESALLMEKRWNFTGTGEMGGVTCSRAEDVRLRQDGLFCENRSDDVLFITLPLCVDTRRDFSVKVEAADFSSGFPLIFIGEEYRPNRYPDIDGYVVAPGLDGKESFLKRKGFIQRLGAPLEKKPASVFSLHKVGDVLHFYQDGDHKLSWCDPDFLHHEQGRVTLGVRRGGTCLLRKAEVARHAAGLRAPSPETPVIRLRTDEQHFFLLNRLALNELSVNFPSVSAYLLENITEVQKRVNVLTVEREALLSQAGVRGDDLVGGSPAMQSIRSRAGIVAASDAAILIQGETGTGKEVLARFIHAKSPRKEGLFVKVDCSTIPRELLESELFGHEKGSFTGAVERRTGLFERADRGTLFLDEVGNLSLAAQAKLLQFLQDHSFTRVGGKSAIRVDVRVMVASNVPLIRLVGEGAFRRDLFHRMDVITVDLPPLRERSGDIAELARHFLSIFNARHGKKISDLSPAAHRKLFDYPWPGNVRELRNVMERAVLFCADSTLGPEWITFSQPEAARGAARKPYRAVDTSPEEIRRLFRENNGVAKSVAGSLGISIRSLYYKIRKNGLSPGELRGT